MRASSTAALTTAEESRGCIPRVLQKFQGPRKCCDDVPVFSLHGADDAWVEASGGGSSEAGGVCWVGSGGSGLLPLG